MSAPDDEGHELGARPLPVLRAHIDVVDRELLGLLARRMSLVSEVARHKRHARVRIRDLSREQQILDDRAERAKGLGLPTEPVTSIFQMLMKASRDRQAELRAEVPESMEPKVIAIIGGEGGMGKALARLFGDLGHAVMSSDLNTSLRPIDAAAAADVVVICVPIRVTAQVIAEVGPHVRDDALLMDVTSLKTAPVEAMLSSNATCEVVGAHPMFGPGSHGFTGQRVVLCRGRGDAGFDWVAQAFSARGLVVHETDPQTHDRMMALVQVLNHFETQVMGLTLSRLGITHDETLPFTSPAYLLENYIVARHFGQASELYGPIEMLNPRTDEVTRAFEDAAREMGDIVRSGSQERFAAVFDEVRAFFGESFTEEAQAETQTLIDRLVELTAGRPTR